MFNCTCTCPDETRTPRGVAWMIGISLACVVVSLGLQLSMGPSPLADALLFGAFPIAMEVSAFATRSARRYARPYGIVVLLLFLAAIYGAFVGISMLSDII